MAKSPSWFRIADRVVSRAIRSVRSHRGDDIVVEPFTVTSTAGYRITGHVHRTRHSGPYKAVVLCPGINDAGTVFDGDQAPVSADEIARLGCMAVHFDPAGRGESWGEEDFGGPEHQDDVATVVRYLAERKDVEASHIGIVSISLGVCMAVGSAAGAGGATPAEVAWLVDWEGPSDREIITAGGTKMAPALGHTLTDETYWAPREAVRHVGQLRCKYIRLQSRVDHAQPGELRHAQRMLDAASSGNIPWMQLNNSPANTWPVQSAWLPAGRLAANRAILRAIALLIRD